MLDPSLVKGWMSLERASMLGEVMGAENRVENLGGGKPLVWDNDSVSIRDSVRVQSLADLETPDGFMNLVRDG